MGSYMVRPALQGKSSSVTKRIMRPYIRPFKTQAYAASGPDGIRASQPHQILGLIMGPRPQQVFRDAGATFYAIT